MGMVLAYRIVHVFLQTPSRRRSPPHLPLASPRLPRPRQPCCSAAGAAQVRELVKAAGMNLLSLRRVRIGGFRLPRDLGLGGFK